MNTIGNGGHGTKTTININENQIETLKEIAEKETGRDHLAKGVEIVLREVYRKI